MPSFIEVTAGAAIVTVVATGPKALVRAHEMVASIGTLRGVWRLGAGVRLGTARCRCPCIMSHRLRLRERRGGPVVRLRHLVSKRLASPLG